MDHYVEIAADRRKIKRRGTQWLMLSFVIGWGLLTALVVLQDRAIDAQRDLIHLLLQDIHGSLAKSASVHRKAMVVDGEVAAAISNSATLEQKSSHVPTMKNPPPSVQSHRKEKSPSSQVKVQGGSKTDRTPPKALKELPVTPPPTVVDPTDRRRVTISI
jgi:hypothetical protein